MKILIIFLYLNVTTISTVAQEKYSMQSEVRVTAVQISAIDSLQSPSGSKFTVHWNSKNGTPTLISGKLAGSDLLQKAGSYESASIEFLKIARKVFALKSPEEEFQYKQKVVDKLGNTHIKLDQYYSGIRVFSAQLIVHFNKKGEVYSVNGRYCPSFDISLSPIISRAQTLQIAINHAKISPDSSRITQIIYTNTDMTEQRLAWNVYLSSKSYPTRQYIIDSKDASILYIDRGIRF